MKLSLNAVRVYVSGLGALLVYGLSTPCTLAADNAVVLSQALEYPAAFYIRYNPNTALDMINQTPGFQLDDGDSSRGLGAAAGNLLINDRRPSAKQDLPSKILARIPASQVKRIEIIRGQIRDIDLQGQAVVANIILHDDIPATIRWDAAWRYNVDFNSTLEGSVSLSDRWRQTDYNTGVSFRRFTRGDFSFQDTFNGSNTLTEKRQDVADNLGYRSVANLNTSTLVGQTMLRFNSNLAGEERDGLRQVIRTPQLVTGVKRDEDIADGASSRQLELGIDAERNLYANLSGKAILLLTHGINKNLSTLTRYNAAGAQTLHRVADTRSDKTEAISRIEIDWTPITDHTIKANLERAFNSLDGTLSQTEDTGSGAVNVTVPGGNSRVEEVRWDGLLKDTWALGQFELDYGLGVETSTISQTGDAVQERSFTFLKPQGVVTHTSTGGTQSRLRLAREVAQLDFGDFISSTVFEDDDLALGNPDLRPDTTWIAEISHERRFGAESVIKLTLFHHWIKDVLDLLPLTPTFEAPGNIGDGTRWGVKAESTLPLAWLGLQGARLAINARWQESSVTDPVTGESRALSSRSTAFSIFPLSLRDDNHYAFSVDYRQDFQSARFAWGWVMRTRAERPLYKVNELDVSDDGYEFNIFAETTRWFGLKTRIVAENIFDMVETRDRTVFTGERDLSPVNFRELRDRTVGFKVSFELSGSF